MSHLTLPSSTSEPAQNFRQGPTSEGRWRDGDPKAALTVQDVAEFLGVPVATVYDWRCKGYGPRGKKVGRYLRYEEDVVRQWFEQLDEGAA